ncbi:MAG: hypothetical protein R3B09_00625 [Nannocystaceae bacterium]
MRRSAAALLRLLGVAVAALLVAPSQPAAACGWDWETYEAEATSLPCVFDALVGFWPKHSDTYHQRRIAAVDHALAWMPGWTEGLDARGISLLKLGRLEEARATMEHGRAAAPEAYASHANLGTLFTFTGDYAAALEHIDAAMKIEPKAHFGREKYHRALVVFLERVAADPEIAKRENFLGLKLDDEERRAGSPERYRQAGLEDDAIDALVAMITVYGADQVAEIYLALGDLLALRGHPRLAYTAYRRAKELGHPRKRELARWMTDLNVAIMQARGRPTRGMGALYARTLKEARAAQATYQKWEEGTIAEGLALWTAAGVDTIYAKIHETRRRCVAPHVIGDPIGGAGPDLAPSEPSEAPKGEEAAP